MVSKLKSTKKLGILIASTLTVVSIIYSPLITKIVRYESFRKDYPKAFELKSNSVYSRGETSIAIGEVGTQIQLTIVDDLDKDYFKTQSVTTGGCIKSISTTICVRALGVGKALLEIL